MDGVFIGVYGSEVTIVGLSAAAMGATADRSCCGSCCDGVATVAVWLGTIVSCTFSATLGGSCFSSGLDSGALTGVTSSFAGAAVVLDVPVTAAAVVVVGAAETPMGPFAVEVLALAFDGSGTSELELGALLMLCLMVPSKISVKKNCFFFFFEKLGGEILTADTNQPPPFADDSA